MEVVGWAEAAKAATAGLKVEEVAVARAESVKRVAVTAEARALEEEVRVAVEAARARVVAERARVAAALAAEVKRAARSADCDTQACGEEVRAMVEEVRATVVTAARHLWTSRDDALPKFQHGCASWHPCGSSTLLTTS